MIRAAIVGCGDVSVVHRRAIEHLDGVELAGTCDVDPSRAPITDHRELLRSVRPDVVHVCTPHDHHVRVATDCLDAGVAVLVEKPVANTVAEAEKLIAAAERNPGVRIGVCLQNRYNATSRAARELLASGALGAVLGASATVCWHRDAAYYQARPWRGERARSGGGVLINQAIHTVDLLEWLIGAVDRVRGQTGRFVHDTIDVEDTATMVLDHVGGARSVLFATVANVVDAPVTIEISTERATLLIRGDLTVRHTDGRVETVAEPVARTGGRAYWGASHELLIADFYRGTGPFWIGPRAGTRSLRLLEQLYDLGKES
ncbi:Gfo/Idh/MocA family protein [Actinoplanes sp. N902-109]|uniref:Gfo/Idh/MocA family protein n=1 Tax=Actinoplanes sp. (strain N902-109) TaxID=649831 RepID=UPI0003295FE6|nr:Gfo/Idh/MocA family oxidoreductase [Actinoplanes sp. N902-109]AGL19852.1 oxidoreductase [Actinoplanes sp. N902-109]